MTAPEFFDSFFNPSSIAIIGISRKRPSLGQMILDNLINSGYDKEIFLINPKTSKINGYPSYSSISAVGKEIELLIILVPAKFILQILDEAGKNKIKAAIVVTAGFSEVSETGKEIELQMFDIAQKYGIRLIGPNSMGTFSQKSHTSFSPIPIFNGEVSYLSQSGSILVVAMEHMLPYEIGFSKFISLGNKIDINTNHALKYLAFDESTKVVNGYIESFSDPKNFRLHASKLTQSKPFVLVKGGRTEAGARAASSHTGALAGEDRLITAVINSSGIIQASNIQEQVEITRFLLKYPEVSEGGIAIVSSAGGPGILASDEIINCGLRLAKLNELTISRLDEIIPPEGSTLNPVDILAAADENTHVETIKILADDPDVTAIILLIVHPVLISTENLLNALNFFQNTTISIICCYLGPNASNYQGLTDLILTKSSYDAIQMIKAGQFYYHWKQNYDAYTDFSHLLGLSIKNKESSVWDLLRSYGFESPKSLISNKLPLIQEFFDKHDSIVMKINHPNFSHKTDVSGVFLDIRNQDQLKQSWDKIQKIYDQHSINSDERDIEVQEFVKNGIEVALGIIHDPLFGHFVMVGSGGTYIELYDDVAFEPLPISRKTSINMIQKLKLRKLFEGFRGTKKINVNLIVDMILQLNKMIVQHPEIKELDLNPLIIDRNSGKAIVVDSRIEYID